MLNGSQESPHPQDSTHMQVQLIYLPVISISLFHELCRMALDSSGICDFGEVFFTFSGLSFLVCKCSFTCVMALSEDVVKIKISEVMPSTSPSSLLESILERLLNVSWVCEGNRCPHCKILLGYLPVGQWSAWAER